jgi:hypothetical protein
MEDRKVLIAQKQKELKMASIRNKMLQFDIAILECETKIDQLENEKALCEQALETEMAAN